MADRLNCLAPFFTWLVGRGLVRRSPLARARRPKAEDAGVRPFARAELQALLDACDGATWLGARNAAIVWVLVDVGLRASELVGLDLADLDQREWTLRTLGKGGKRRTGRLGAAARVPVADCVRLMRGDVPGPLFPSLRGGRLRRDILCQLLAALGKRTGVAQVHPHRFRHTFATEFLRASGDPFRLQLLLGHSSLERRRRYTAFLTMEDALDAHVEASPGDALRLRSGRRR